ncbi:U3 small nucleolar ribonucleoprotein MPP10 isoform X2 [Poecilia reticulata]|uniref:U3 small nucleolar ribonucleoprotein MPP10 isoform X2 n=1 Tax=Poecilia reticulata TaxID=8081 RepID=UPI0004A234CB|nr:PREDICTED: U3 small nucleolar ribonucleoprotein protein MPP10 isoform X2 [Poecilia reticulata]
MANREMRRVLEDCVKIINDNTAQPENFLSLQDGPAAEFTSLTKTLYDLQKSVEPAGCKRGPLPQLVVDNFDEEQIWQELEIQNNAVMKHFKDAIDETLIKTLLKEDTEEEDENEEEAEGETDDENDTEQPSKLRNKKAAETQSDSEEDSDIDFDVDALEKREKQKKQGVRNDSRTKVVPSEVDDKFFKLSEMESFLDEMDKREGKEDEREDDVDYFQDVPSDEDEDLDLDEIMSSKEKKNSMAKSSRNLKYKDFFDAVDGGPAKINEQSDDDDDDDDDDEMEDIQDEGEEEDFDEEEEDDDDGDGGSPSKASRKKVTFDLSGEEDSEGEDMEEIFGGKTSSSEKSEVKSSYEKRQEKMSQKIQELENAALAEKAWQLSGEVTAQTRPENSMLEEDVEFEQASRLAPAITEETTLQLEDIIKQRIKDQAFDDVERKEKPKEEVFEYKKRLTLDHEKSKQSLAQIYEQEYIKQIQNKTEEKENPAHVEIQKLMDTLFLKLDALSNFHFTPKPPVPEVKVVSNLPSITMEEVAPVSTSDATLLAPEEVKEKNKAGDLLGDTEKTSTDKKRERRHKKKAKRLKIQEKEKRQKLKEASRTGGNKKPSKAEVTENLKKLTKGGKAVILKDEGKDKALRSSQAFFSQLQDQVKSQIKSTKEQSSKKKKQKEVSVSKLKL